MLGNEFDAFCSSQSSPLPKTIRINTLRNEKDDFFEWQRAMHPDWKLTPHIFGEHIFSIEREHRKTPLGKSLGHVQGRFYVQEASSCLPPLALDIRPGQKVLDMAASPGSKTTQIAALMRGKGLLVANEYSASRIKTLVFNLQKTGVSHALVTRFSGEKFADFLPNFFDRILLDAPCTGEGTARKDPDALAHWSEKRIHAAAILQRSLLRSAFLALKTGGLLTYSTCTLAPEENEAVVSSLQEQFFDAVEVVDICHLFPGANAARGLLSYDNHSFPHGKKMLRIWPHAFNSEGFFVATIRKTKDTPSLPKKRFVMHGHKRLNMGEILRHKDSTTHFVREYFLRTFSFSLPKERLLFRRHSDIWLLPEGAEAILPAVRCERLGIRLGKIIPPQRTHTSPMFRLSNEAVLAFGQHFSGECVYRTSHAEACAFLQGNNISCAHPLPKQDIAVMHDGLPLGVGKSLGTVIKNNLPRHFLVGDVS